MMKVQVEAGKNLDFYYDLYNDQAIPKSAYMEAPLCDMDQHRSKFLNTLLTSSLIRPLIQ